MYESEATKEFVTEVEWLKSSPPITETARRSAQVPGKALPDDACGRSIEAIRTNAPAG